MHMCKKSVKLCRRKNNNMYFVYNVFERKKYVCIPYKGNKYQTNEKKKNEKIRPFLLQL